MPCYKLSRFLQSLADGEICPLSNLQNAIPLRCGIQSLTFYLFNETMEERQTTYTDNP